VFGSKAIDIGFSADFQKESLSLTAFESHPVSKAVGCRFLPQLLPFLLSRITFAA
jgi:hypothetical protein